MILKGDTVRLKVNFKTFDGTSVNPTDIKLTIYDSTETQIEQIAITDTNKDSVGVYFYDYVVPDDVSEYFIFEFGGLYNGKPILSRGKVAVQFIK